jgi:hypothetical protein
MPDHSRSITRNALISAAGAPADVIRCWTCGRVSDRRRLPLTRRGGGAGIRFSPSDGRGRPNAGGAGFSTAVVRAVLLSYGYACWSKPAISASRGL